MIFTCLFQCVPLKTIDRPCLPAMTTADHPHRQSSASYLCHPHVISHPSCLILKTIAIQMLLWMSQSERLLQESHDCPKANDFNFSYREKTTNGTDDVTAWSYYEIPDWPIPMLPLLQMMIKNLLQYWAPSSARTPLHENRRRSQGRRYTSFLKRIFVFI